MGNLHLVHPSNVLQIAQRVSELLTPAVERSDGRYEIWDVMGLILQGHMQLWIYVKNDEIVAAGVTQILTFPRKKVLGFPFVGGSFMREWRHCEPEVARWAREQGCRDLEGYDARHGAWARVLKGWTQNYINMVKPL